MKDNRLLDGRAVRDRILGDVADRVRRASTTHTLGRLVSISIGEHKEVGVYVRGQATAAQKVGLRLESQTWPSTLSQAECKARLVAMNDDRDVLGVILQRPVPKHFHGRSLASSVTSTPSGVGTVGVRRCRRIQSRQRFRAMRYSQDENFA